MKRLFIAAILLSLATGCASTKQFVPLPDQNKLVGADKARIYVVRPTTMGCGVPMKVSDGGQLIGQTGPKSYLCWERNPGAVEITSKAENKAKLPLNAEPGKAYYIQQHVRMGILYARNKLTLLNEAEGKEMVSKCSPAK
jgi:hypothetical protein